MLEKMDIGDEENGHRMVWLLMRLGYSQQPPRSERLAIEEFFI
jgi:hypothetical protein